jgi:hypothetical protein
MRVLIGHETTQTLCEAFTKRGHDAMSCDLKPGQKGLPHYQGNILDILNEGWDMAIFHPDCTYLTNAANRWLHQDCSTGTAKDRLIKRDQAIEHFIKLQNAPIPKIAIENPQPHPYVIKRVGKYSDKVQPYFFNSDETKGYCWWLKGLPPLMTTVYYGGDKKARVHMESPQGDRAARRSKMCEFMAEAIADQWGTYGRL